MLQPPEPFTEVPVLIMLQSNLNGLTKFKYGLKLKTADINSGCSNRPLYKNGLVTAEHVLGFKFVGAGAGVT